MNAQLEPPESLPDGNTIGIPVHIESAGAASILDWVVLARLCVEERRVASALRRGGLKLGHALYISNSRACYEVSVDTTAMAPQHANPDAIKKIVTSLPARAQRMPRPPGSAPPSGRSDGAKAPQTRSVPSAGSEFATNGDINALRREILFGPQTIQVGGEDVPWAGVIDAGGADDNPTDKVVTCSLTGSEHHLLDDGGNRIRPENPRDADGVAPGSCIEISQVRTESVLVTNIDNSQAQLDFTSTGDD